MVEKFGFLHKIIERLCFESVTSFKYVSISFDNVIILLHDIEA